MTRQVLFDRLRIGGWLQWKRSCTLVSIGLALLCLFACAPNTRVVLLPDPDGHVGKIEVGNEAGMQVLDKSWEATAVAGAGKKPQPPAPMEQKEIRELFGEAMEAQPPQPVSFLIFFESDSARPSTASLGLLPKVIDAVKDRKSVYISIIGHTDTVGRAEYNRRLSLKRARAIADLLVARGIDRSLIEIDYFGKEKPLVQTPDGVAEPRNRRVEITVR
ncbi:MAG: Peptidoglycan-associated lipoprotein [Syntrophus sp. SKADARSKE-3]|nr:Peptidoglycan-associated lipoprotein [Syntrophus sp. SKADARSKE-3]